MTDILSSLYTYIYTHIYLTASAIFRLLHPPSEDSQGQETVLATSADNQTHIYNTECSNHHPTLSTLEIVSYIHTRSPVNVIVILHHPWSLGTEITRGRKHF